MRVGLDFDNTLAGYDRLFARLASEAGYAVVDTKLGAGYAAPGTKKAVRDAVRAGPEGDMGWQKLQAAAYGKRMAEAELIDGVAEALDGFRARGWDVVVVSHKTEVSPVDPERVSLRAASLAWMEAQGFFTRFGLKRDDVHFLSTRAGKVARIKDLACDAFVDDLEEVYAEPGFPQATARYLFHPGLPVPEGDFRAFRTWRELANDLFDRYA